MVSIGFVGLGAMGGRMVQNLLDANYDVVAYDLDDSALEAAVEAGATPGESLEAVARTTDVIMLSLPGPEAIVTVVEELTPGLASGDILVDLSTSTPSTTNAVADGLSDAGADMLGAPVSGGPSGAEDGTLSIMVGGTRSTYDECLPILEAVGADIFYIGDSPGDGHAIKLLNNYLSFVAMICTSEIIVLGEAIGLEKEVMLDVFNVSSARNTATSFKYPEYILPETYDMDYKLSLVDKDMRLLLDVAETQGTPFLSGGTISQLIAYMRKEYGPDADYTEFYKFFSDVMRADREG